MTHNDTKQNLTLMQEPTEQNLNHGALRGVLASLETEGAVRAAAEASRATRPEQVLSRLKLTLNSMTDLKNPNPDGFSVTPEEAGILRGVLRDAYDQLSRQQAELERVRGLVNGAWQDAEELGLDVSLSGADALDNLQTKLIQIRAALAANSVEISRIPTETTGEATAEKPFNSPLWRLLEAEQLDLIDVNAMRQEGGLPVTFDEDQLLFSAVAILLERLSAERKITRHLAERHDALRLKYAQLEGDLYHTKNKLAHAAKKHGSESLKSLVAQLPAQSRTDVLKSLPTGAAIAQEGREGAAQ